MGDTEQEGETKINQKTIHCGVYLNESQFGGGDNRHTQRISFRVTLQWLLPSSDSDFVRVPC